MSTPTAPAALTFPTGGACTGRPDLMNPDPNDPEALETAVETCLSCTAYTACLAWITITPATEDPGGVIAALTEHERAERHNPAAPPEPPAPPTRHCPRCGQDKDPTEFPASARAWCADCHRSYARDRYHRLNPNAQYHTDIQNRTRKTCPACKKTKPNEDFARNNARPDGLSSTCKTCHNAHSRQRRAARQGRA
uniref:hypothetical protein n=1 Tax=Streptosporangium sp. CA-235898 TaxID=3240073 RepID=UPI003F493BE9